MQRRTNYDQGITRACVADPRNNLSALEEHRQLAGIDW